MNHAPAWGYSNLPQGPVWLLGHLQGCEGIGGTGVQGAGLGVGVRMGEGILSFLPTPRYLFCCAAGSHLPLSMSHLLGPPPAHSVVSSPVGPGTFPCRLAGEREGSQTSLWSLDTGTSLRPQGVGSSLYPSHTFPTLQVPH